MSLVEAMSLSPMSDMSFMYYVGLMDDTSRILCAYDTVIAYMSILCETWHELG